MFVCNLKISNGKTVAESILQSTANQPPIIEKLPKINVNRNNVMQIMLLIFCGFKAKAIPTANAKTETYHIDQQFK